jgi:hypothetical protein
MRIATIGMEQLFGGMLQQLGADGVLHRPLHQLRPQPVLVIGQPFVTVRPAQQIQQFIHIHSDYFASFRSHTPHPPYMIVVYCSAEPT